MTVECVIVCRVVAIGVGDRVVVRERELVVEQVLHRAVVEAD